MGDPEPQPEEPAQEPPQEPPQPLPRPRHRRTNARQEPPVLRPRRTNAGQNRWRNEDNAYGDEPPAEIDARESELDLMHHAILEAQAEFPQSHRDAMNSPEAQKWFEAEKEEYNSLMHNKTWIIVPRPSNRKIVKCR